MLFSSLMAWWLTITVRRRKRAARLAERKLELPVFAAVTPAFPPPGQLTRPAAVQRSKRGDRQTLQPPSPGRRILIPLRLGVSA